MRVPYPVTAGYAAPGMHFTIHQLHAVMGERNWCQHVHEQMRCHVATAESSSGLSTTHVQELVIVRGIAAAKTEPRLEVPSPGGY